MNRITSVYILFSTLFLTFQFIGLYSENNHNLDSKNILSPLLFYFSWLISIFIPKFLPNTKREERKITYKKSINLAIIFLFIELLTRLTLYNPSRGFIYALKSSYFYFDSNFSGLIIASLISFSLYLKLRLGLKLTHQLIALTVLLFLTFSRGAILTTFIVYITFYSIKYFKIRAYITLFATVVFFCYMTYQYLFLDMNFQSIDGSFNSKFYIFKLAYDLFPELSLNNKLFGIGLGNTELYLGFFAHNIFVTFFLEFGILGSFLFLLFVTYTIIKSNSFTLFIWLPTLIGGVSLFGAYSPYIFILATIILSEEISFKFNRIDS
ncbi:O-antigen ligase family protein [Providencia huaxiensis]|uniref:O-antigen ligase family protein n=1 Tax=Providencia huaxiensis TaxID=2027290 RepID=UPI000C7EFA09|nr:O-antigen ligase family protein [Providencia huaxiensis]AXH63518.1 hypothetical protein CYG50_16645 [Providencia huaxiensis]